MTAIQSVAKIFETVSAHLLSQNAVSEDGTGTCRLRGDNGRRCAIGVLVMDEFYNEQLEGLGFAYYKADQDGPLPQALARSGIDAHDPLIVSLLNELEEIHDAGDTARWEEQLRGLGQEYGLSR